MLTAWPLFLVRALCSVLTCLVTLLLPFSPPSSLSPPPPLHPAAPAPNTGPDTMADVREVGGAASVYREIPQ